jgi:hypothetical protein
VTTKQEDAYLLAPTQEVTGTVGDDVLTVHKLSEGKPVCGATGELTEWQRAVTCSACVAAE